MTRSPQLAIGSRVGFQGATWVVEAHEPPAVRLRADDGRQALVAVSALLGADDFVALEYESADDSEALSRNALLDSVPETARRRAEELEAHLLEVTTGFRSVHAQAAASERPRAEYASERRLCDKLNAKSVETGRSSRQLERDLKAYREHGLWGLIDRRGTAGKSTAERLDRRVRGAMESVIAELVDKSNVTLVQARRLVVARLREEHGRRRRMPAAVDLQPGVQVAVARARAAAVGQDAPVDRQPPGGAVPAAPADAPG